MNSFRKKILEQKTVVIWGAGYLGYTEVLRMQSRGFTTILWELNKDRLHALQKGLYPTPGMAGAWSLGNALPLPDMEKLRFFAPQASPSPTAVHLICTPMDSSQNDLKQMWHDLAHCLGDAEDSLLLFLSATSPGFIDSTVSKELRCGIATAFRRDWYFEEILTDTQPCAVGANDERSLLMARTFFDILQQPCRCLPSIKAAEVMTHAEQLLQNMNSTFVNQLALAFPDTDVRQLAPELFQRLAPRLRAPTLGQMDVRQFMALCHLTSGQGNTDKLTLSKEAQRASLSLLLSYADMLLSHKIRHAAILGLSPLLAAQRDPRMSPSLILADYLHQHGMDITVHDPSYDQKSLAELLPYAEVWHLDAPTTADAVILMRDIPSCRALTQNQLEELGITSARIVFDNTGMYRFNLFPDTCFYHIPGDGRLHILGN